MTTNYTYLIYKCEKHRYLSRNLEIHPSWAWDINKNLWGAMSDS